MGTLYIVATPIGNMEDITIRAIKTLFAVDFIACEDTRRTGMLLQELRKRFQHVIPAFTQKGQVGIQSKKELDPRFHGDDKKMFDGVNPQLIRYDDNHEQSQTPLLIQKMEEGKSVALVSDAGTPLIADPGYTLVHEAIRRGISVVSIPGPSAAIAALSISGIPANHFLFLGYPPEKEKHRKDLFRNLLTMQRSNLASPSGGHPTIIFYCAPHKLQQTLGDMKEIFDDIPIVIAREVTKVHEEIWRGKLSEAINNFSNPQGEFVLIINL